MGAKEAVIGCEARFGHVGDRTRAAHHSPAAADAKAAAIPSRAAAIYAQLVEFGAEGKLQFVDLHGHYSAVVATFEAGKNVVAIDFPDGAGPTNGRVVHDERTAGFRIPNPACNGWPGPQWFPTAFPGTAGAKAPRTTLVARCIRSWAPQVGAGGSA